MGVTQLPSDGRRWLPDDALLVHAGAQHLKGVLLVGGIDRAEALAVVVVEPVAACWGCRVPPGRRPGPARAVGLAVLRLQVQATLESADTGGCF